MSAKLIPPSTMKRITTHCVAGANASMEFDLVERPAVGIVVKACAIAWKGVISSSTPESPSPSRIGKRRRGEGT